jgi:primase-polymerase (primpol)-like protein
VRYKWVLSENYVDGKTVARAEVDPRLDGRVFIQLETDPFVFVDGDDVRCPESGEVCPEFLVLLDRLGVTYGDVSTSGSGVHAHYTGELPGEQGQAVFEIADEPWGANDSPPTVEIYTNKHVCVTSGEHVDGTPSRLGNVTPKPSKRFSTSTTLAKRPNQSIMIPTGIDRI